MRCFVACYSNSIGIYITARRAITNIFTIEVCWTGSHLKNISYSSVTCRVHPFNSNLPTSAHHRVTSNSLIHGKLSQQTVIKLMETHPQFIPSLSASSIHPWASLDVKPNNGSETILGICHGQMVRPHTYLNRFLLVYNADDRCSTFRVKLPLEIWVGLE